MKLPSFIVKNYRSQYYFRIHVEKCLIPIIGKTELRKSLRTTCPIVAMERARPYLIAAKAWFENLKEKHGMTTDDAWGKISKRVLTIGEIFRAPDGSIKVSNVTTDGTQADQDALDRILNGPAAVTLPSTTSIPSPANPELLSARLEIFVKTREKGKKGFDKKTENAYRGVVNLFIEMFGDKHLHQYTEHDAVKFRDILLELPPNSRHYKKWKDLTIEQIIELDPEEKLSSKRIEDQLVRMRSIWSMALKKNTALINIFEDVNVEVQINKGQPFTHIELCDIFDPRHLEITADHPSHYWALLIALFTGMRRSEIFFRTVDDIKEEGGIWYFDITRIGDKKTKTKVSVRKVPIHSELIRLGFLDYVAHLSKKNKAANLFPEYNNTGGQAGNKFTDFFINYRKKVGITGTGKKFHSFRNTFISRLEEQETYSPLLSRLVGHSTGKITHDVYGGNYSLDKLSEAVEKVKWPNVTCSIPKWNV